MKTEAEISAYVENLDRKDEQLENEVVRHQQLHQLCPDAGHERRRVLAERQLLAGRAGTFPRISPSWPAARPHKKGAAR